MIKANELRIGNYVEAFVGVSIGMCKICEILKDDRIIVEAPEELKQNNEKYIRLNCEEIEPAPLTPAILKKCGFKKCIDGYLHLDDVMFFDDCLYLDEGNGNIPVPHIKYLHQLQNIYHPLVGQELNIQNLISSEKDIQARS